MGISYYVQEVTGGKPREGFVFQRGARVWRYTSGRDLLTLSGITFVPASIKRSEFRRADANGAAKVTISVALATPMAQQMLQPHPSPMTVTIYRTHEGAPDKVTPFRGTVESVQPTDTTIEIIAVTVEGQLHTPVPRVLVMRTCQNALYDERCGLSRVAWETNFTILSVDTAEKTITLTNAPGPDDSYQGGMIATSDNMDLFITTQKGAVLGYLGILSPQVIPGALLRIAPGCDKKIETCHNKFNNVPNFLGFPWLPEQNPFVNLE